MKELVFFLEEESAKALLEPLFPRIVPKSQISPRFIVFEGKQDLQKQLERKLRSYLNPQAQLLYCAIRTRVIVGKSSGLLRLSARVRVGPRP